LSEFLIDTNILVYPYDPRDHDKQRQAQIILERLVGEGVAVLSVQCLTEFFRAVRWRLAEPLTLEQALLRIERFVANCRVLPLTPSAALDAFRAYERYSMSFWDSLIWAVAKEGDVPYLLTEDFDHGATVEGVQFLNPFAESFDLAPLMA